jgi:glycosyltransferase involved in cell wall biosynthesis
MKIAVYTIALNEEQFVRRWHESAKDADYLLIADTGSTDNTARLAQRLGINVVSISVKPWRFDDARNAALALLPDNIDLCVSLDMDEVLSPGWRTALEDAWSRGITRPRYKHVWSWKEDGSPGLEFAYDHIHARHGYRWKHPVHEALYHYGEGPHVAEFIEGIETHHRPDPNKSRSQYLPLLKMSVEEEPHNDRNAYYYARELFFYARYEEAAKEFKRHLSLPSATWLAERASSLRYLAKCEPNMARHYLAEAVSITKERREARVELAQLGYNEKDWELCYNQATQAIAIENKPLDYLCEEFAWGWLPYDLAAISAYYLDKKEEAIRYGELALNLDPDNDRLKNNLVFYYS